MVCGRIQHDFSLGCKDGGLLYMPCRSCISCTEGNGLNNLRLCGN